jgi:transposase-like protein
MNNKIKCPKCGKIEKVKCGFIRGKQRYLCKNCQCRYVNSKKGYPESVKNEALRYYNEGLGFRRIERFLGMSHVSVINWVKQAAEKLKKIVPKEQKVEVLELDELCINFKKKSGFGLQ